MPPQNDCSHIGNLVCFRLGAVVLALLLADRGAAATPRPDVAATELVRQTVAQELAAANAGGHYMYQFHEETPRGSETHDMIETNEWLIGRLIRRNGKPLSPRERQKEDERLRSLVTNRARLKKIQKEQSYTGARTRRMIAAFPAAFFFQSVGTDKDRSGHGLTRLTFRPNPAFTPDSSELRVLQGMKGTMLIDPEVKRLVRVEAKLFQDVDFGWGILGHIYRGGSFLFEQRGVGPDRWVITTLKLDYTNRQLLAFTSRVSSVRRASNFRRMPDDLTLQQGLELLLRQDQMTTSTQ